VKLNQSERIFRNDPLILSSESQAEYGVALLENVLLLRTSKFGLPDIVDFYDEAPEPEGEVQPVAPSPLPNDDLAQRYFESRVSRKKIKASKREQVALREVTAVCAGERTSRRRRRVTDKQTREQKQPFASHEKAREALGKHRVDINQRLRIAAIGLRVRVSSLVGKAHLKEDLCVAKPLKTGEIIRGIPDKAGIPELGRTRRPARQDPKNKRWERWTETLLNHVETAVTSGSHVVVFPEFALPPDVKGKSIEQRLRSTFEHMRTHYRSHFVFAGSRHEGGVNRGPIYYLKPDKPLHDEEWHYKLASARALGENILGPRSDAYKTYRVVIDGIKEKSFPIHVTVAVCYDTFDPSTFLSLVRQSAKIESTQTAQVILVPSFNPSEDFVQLLRDLSFLTGALVIYVNSLHGDARAFIAGCSVKALLDSSSAELVKHMTQYITELEKKRGAASANMQKADSKNDARAVEDNRKRANLFLTRQKILQNLRERVRKLIKRKGLEHLITVEFCQQCKDRSHADDYGCLTDILYYNIDVELLEILKIWRRGYIQSTESFIPAPFQYDQLQKARKEDDQRRKERDARKAATGIKSKHSKRVSRQH